MSKHAAVPTLRRLTGLSFFAAVVVAALAISVSVRALSAPVLSIGTTTGSATVSISGLDGDSQFNGFDITLSFDASAGHVTAVNAAGLWNINLVAPVIDNSAGTVHVVGIMMSPACGAGCQLFTLTFAQQGVASSASVALTSSQLATANGQSLPALAAPLPDADVPFSTTPTRTPTAPLTPTPATTATPTSAPNTTTPVTTATSPAGGSTATTTVTTPAATSTAAPATPTSTAATPTRTATVAASASPSPSATTTTGATTPLTTTTSNAGTGATATPKPPATGSGTAAATTSIALLGIVGLSILFGVPAAMFVSRRRSGR